MKFEVGMNANPVNGFVPYDISGMFYGRFPLWIVQNRGFDYSPFINGVHELGMWNQIVFDSRTFPDSDYVGTLQRVKKKYPQINWIQTGLNEFDNKSDSSSYATPARVDRIIRATRQVFGDNVWLTAPAVTSADGPTKLQQLKTLELCNSIAYHPYGIRPEHDYPEPTWGFGEIQYVHQQYAEIAQAYNLQIEVSELGFDRGMFNNEHERAVAHSKMLNSLVHLGAHRAAVFCLGHVMHPEFALMDANGNPYESYAAVFTAGPTIDVPSPPNTHPLPLLEYVQGLVVGRVPAAPEGVILHGTRSGIRGNPVYNEYLGTLNYVRNGTNGITGWNATIGDNMVCEHMSLDEWGWDARAASRRFFDYEFAQGTQYDEITDAQVYAMAWHFVNRLRARFPNTPRHFITHAEAEHAGLTGVIDGKTDTFPYGDPRADQLKARINAAIDTL